MEKHKHIIPNFEKFKEECKKDSVTTVRRNDLKARNDFEEKLAEDFNQVEQASWNKKVYRLGKIDKPGKSLLHWRGEYYSQEESATLPVKALEPQEGDNVLDMCAAPGGKTTQIADQINNTGTIVANDKSSNRLQSLHANIYRTGSYSAKVTNYDGRRIPEDQKFDKILVDAPCTGEGDKARRQNAPANQKEIQELSKLQKQLLKKANSLLKQDGEIVYSTCTINTKENEQVVNHTLRETDLKLAKIKNKPNKYQKGLKKLQEKSLDNNLSKTVRVLPHHLNSGAIYVAKLKK